MQDSPSDARMWSRFHVFALFRKCIFPESKCRLLRVRAEVNGPYCPALQIVGRNESLAVAVTAENHSKSTAKMVFIAGQCVQPQ